MVDINVLSAKPNRGEGWPFLLLVFWCLYICRPVMADTEVNASLIKTTGSGKDQVEFQSRLVAGVNYQLALSSNQPIYVGCLVEDENGELSVIYDGIMDESGLSTTILFDNEAGKRLKKAWLVLMEEEPERLRKLLSDYTQDKVGSSEEQVELIFREINTLRNKYYMRNNIAQAPQTVAGSMVAKSLSFNKPVVIPPYLIRFQSFYTKIFNFAQ